MLLQGVSVSRVVRADKLTEADMNSAVPFVWCALLLGLIATTYARGADSPTYDV
ncbi:hypothetical protein NP493_37g00007 [Ridgeia piscesae]|uniref:Uncharacterized protein n=1 Tax=Ridgeia piscesae TaxID=27915 RepID=A0AAD9UJY6_RIDPI|nr:hypothetical protein NP493_37g00007 [Ridgeia piscesae]